MSIEQNIETIAKVAHEDVACVAVIPIAVAHFRVVLMDRTGDTVTAEVVRRVDARFRDLLPSSYRCEVRTGRIQIEDV